ncbi:MAG TPA: hypothetical protein VFB53_11070 [Burkholderiales bacterium]|nr:hypothetical protein [Burkholderiales bacterium]
MKHVRSNPGLAALYARLDEIRMSPADRLAARSALAQADALADFLLGAMRLVRRLAGARPRGLLLRDVMLAGQRRQRAR